MSDEQPPQHYFLVIQRSIGDPAAAGPLIPAHWEFLRSQLAHDRLVLTGTGETEGAAGPDAGFLLVRADSFDAVREIMEQDPFIREGVRSYELLRVTPMNGLLRVSFWGAAGVLE
jgi:uncharacterized protein YciI